MLLNIVFVKIIVMKYKSRIKKSHIKKIVSVEELAKYSDRYILLSEDNTKIFAGARTIKELNNKTKHLKIKNAHLHYVPPIEVAHSYYYHVKNTL